MSINGKAFPRAERGLEDDGAMAAVVKPCCVRTGDGHCYLDDGHPGDHAVMPTSSNGHSHLAIEHGPARPEPKSQAPASEVEWPPIGSRYRDSTGRILTVSAVDPESPIERHIIGTVDGYAYACGRRVFDTTWCVRL